MEVLICVGVVGVLIALVLPAFRGGRDSARRVEQLSHLRQLGITMGVYDRTYRGVMPWAAPGDWIQVTPEPGGSILASFWDLRFYWTGLLHDIAPWREHFATWVVPSHFRDAAEPWKGPGHGIPSYSYVRSCFARPLLWSGSSGQSPAGMLRPVRFAEVRFPSSKVMFFDSEAPARAARSTTTTELDHRSMLFVDGHAEARRLSEASTPVAPALGTGSELAEPLHDTRGGAHGRDY